MTIFDKGDFSVNGGSEIPLNQHSLAWLTSHTERVLALCRRQSGDFVFYVPGSDDKYPAFWVRDAVMQVRSGLISEAESRAMLKVILNHQNGPQERVLAHGLRVEPWAIPDHIVLPGFGPEGRPPGAVFFPGTYSSTDDQGTGNYGLRSAADDVYETVRLARLVRGRTRRAGAFAPRDADADHGRRNRLVLEWPRRLGGGEFP